MEMFERARELAAEMRPAMIDFAQRGIRCPSLPGEERAFAQLVLKELQTLGYVATCVDDWGNVMGMVRGNAEGSHNHVQCPSGSRGHRRSLGMGRL